MKVTLLKDGIYGKAGEAVGLGTKKAIELGLFGSRSTIETLTEETADEVVVTTKVKENK